MKKALTFLLLVLTYVVSWAQQTNKNSVLLSAGTIISNSDLKRIYIWNGDTSLYGIEGKPSPAPKYKFTSLEVFGDFTFGNLVFSGEINIKADKIGLVLPAGFQIEGLTQIEIIKDTHLTYPGQQKGSSINKENKKLITVKSAQEILQKMGYDVGTADGIFGKRTENAIKAFQKVNKLNQSGKLDEVTSAALLNSGSTIDAKLKIGDTYAGGIIFYLDSSGEHGKVCSKSELGVYSWAKAKAECENYSEGGYTDWYLPSYDELNQIYLNLQKKAHGSFPKFYPPKELQSPNWSSSESGSAGPWGTAFSLDFADGSRKVTDKDNHGRVRAVRAF